MLDERNVLDAQKVFVSMALINILKTPLSQLPFAISTTMQVSEFSHRFQFKFVSTNKQFSIIPFQALVSLRRLAKYLCSEELKVDSVSKTLSSSGKTIFQCDFSCCSVSHSR